MANPVVNGSLIKCDQACSLPPGVPVPKAPSYPPGMPGNFTVIPANRVMSGNQPVATIMDNKPFVNITPFQVHLPLPLQWELQCLFLLHVFLPWLLLGLQDAPHAKFLTKIFLTPQVA